MAYRDGTRIITDGLVLSLDASDANSYTSGSSVWYDLSGNNYTGSLVNVPSFNKSNLGNMIFDGVNDYVNLGKPTLLNNLTSSFTINAWIKIVTPPSPGQFYTIYEKGIVTSNEQTFFRVYNPGMSSSLQFGSYTTSPVDTQVIVVYDLTGSLYNSGDWNFVTARFNGSSWVLYVNGALAAQTNSAATPYTSTSDCSIGGGYIFNKFERFFNGTIGAVQIYNRALSDYEVLQNYQAQKGRYFDKKPSVIIDSSLLLYLDAANPDSYLSYANNSTSWYNLASSTVSGSLKNGPMLSSIDGGCFEFDGINDIVDVTSSLLSTTSSITLNAFCKLTSTSFSGDIVVINDSSNSTSVTLYYHTDNKFYASVVRQTVASYTVTSSAITDTGSFYMVTGVFNGSSERLYINGSYIGSASYLTTGANLLNSRAAVGASYNLSSPGSLQRFFKGRIAVAQIYNRALTDVEVLQTYNALSPRFTVSNEPLVVRDSSLILEIDAAHPNSYASGSSTAYDLAKNLYTASLISNVSYSVDPVAGPVFEFSASRNSQVFVEARSSGSVTGSYTAEAWYKTPPIQSVRQSTVLSRGNDGAGLGWSVLITHSSSSFVFATNTSSPTTVDNVATYALSAPNLVPTSSWYHVVGTWNAGSSVSVYVNGDLKQQTTVTATNLRTSTVGWSLGRVSTSRDNCTGSIAVARVYDRVLSAAEIKNNYDAQKSRFGLT